MKLNLYGSDALTWDWYPHVADSQVAERVSRVLEGVLTTYGFRGISAPQIGIMLNLATVNLDGGGFLTLMNPEIVRMYGPEIDYFEECISLPPRGNGCRVTRTLMVDVEYWGLECGDMVKQTRTFSGGDASTVNHEIDHLAGTFFFERSALVNQPKVLDKFEQWKTKWRSNGHHPIYEKMRRKK